MGLVLGAASGMRILGFFAPVPVVAVAEVLRFGAGVEGPASAVGVEGRVPKPGVGLGLGL